MHQTVIQRPPLTSNGWVPTHKLSVAVRYVADISMLMDE